MFDFTCSTYNIEYMGMFDYFNVHIDLLKNVDESLLPYIKKINDDQDYANFQTKSLENCLTEYTLDDDGQLFERSTFMYDDMEHSATKTADNVSCYPTFYDYFETEQNSVRLVLECHIHRGQLQGEITVNECVLTPIKDLKQQNDMHKENWEKIRQTPEWQMCLFVRKLHNNCNNFFTKIEQFLDKRSRQKYYPNNL